MMILVGMKKIFTHTTFPVKRTLIFKRKSTRSGINTADVTHLRNTPGICNYNLFIWRVRCDSEPLYALRVHLSRPPALLHRQHKQILDDYRQLARADILFTLKLFSTLKGPSG